jgi:hypothetical protein
VVAADGACRRDVAEWRVLLAGTVSSYEDEAENAGVGESDETVRGGEKAMHPARSMQRSCPLLRT